MTVRLEEAVDSVEWSELAAVIERAGLGRREPEQLRRAFGNSFRACFAYDGSRLVGAGRALSDGEYYAAIYDVVVLPEYQGRGLGTSIMNHLIEGLPQGPVILFAAPGREPFYERLGFHRLKTGMGRFSRPDRVREQGLIE